MDEQALFMCDKPDLLEYIAKLHVEADDLREENEKLKEEIEDINKLTQFAQDKHKEFMETHSNHIKSLEKEIDKLKNPVIYDRDMRCSQLDMRVGYSYISECIEDVLPHIMPDDPDWDVSALPDVVYQEVAKTIDSAINSYMGGEAARQSLNPYIYTEVCDKLEELKEQGLIKEE